MREFIIKDWKSQEAAPETEDRTEARTEPEEVEEIRPPPPAAAPEDAEDTAPDVPEAAAAPAIVRVEPEDQTLGGAIRMKRFPAVVAVAPHTEEPRPAPREARAVAPQRKRGERRFIIAYDGVFVGFFEAVEEVTPREAFVRVAQDMAEDESFDPDKLALYKPVLLRSARPARGVNVIRGKMARLSWQPKKATLVPEPEVDLTAAQVEAEGVI
jgi:hypothetical protein